MKEKTWISLMVGMIAFFSVSTCGAVVIEDWVAHYDRPFDSSSKDDWASAMTIDGSGNVYVTGKSYQDVYTDYLTIKYLPNGTVAPGWPQRYNGSEDHHDQATAIAVDGEGNVYVTGVCNEIIGGQNYVTIKYLPDGTVASGWPQSYDGPDHKQDLPLAMAVDDDGNVYVTGASKANTSVSGQDKNYDYLTIKYEPGGDIASGWPQRYSGTGTSPPAYDEDRAYALAVDDAGNVYVTGVSTSAFNGSNMLTIKYEPDGDIASGWPKRELSASWGNALALDGLRNAYVTGYGGNDYFTVKYDPNGIVASGWPQTYNGANNTLDEANAIAVDSSGNVYVTGRSTGATGNYDYLTLKYLPGGAVADGWPQGYDGFEISSLCGAKDLALDGFGNVYVTGYSWTGSAYDNVTIMYLSDGTVAEGWPVSHDSHLDGMSIVTAAVETDGSGNVYVAGVSNNGPDAGLDYTTVKYSWDKIVLESEPLNQGVLHRQGTDWNDIHMYLSMKNGTADVDCSSIQVLYPRYDGTLLPLSMGSGITANGDGTCSVEFNMGASGFPGNGNAIPTGKVSIDLLVKAENVGEGSKCLEGLSMNLAYVPAGEPAPLQVQAIALVGGQIRLVGQGGQPFPAGGYNWSLPCKEAEWPGGTTVDCGGLSPDPAGHPAEVTYTPGTDSGRYQVVMIDANGSRVERDLASFGALEVSTKVKDVLTDGAVCTTADQSGCVETETRTVVGTTLLFEREGVHPDRKFDWTITDDAGAAVASAAGLKRIEHTFGAIGRYYVKAFTPQTFSLAAAGDQVAVTEVFVGEADTKAIVLLASDGTGNQCVWGHILREALETFRCAGLGDDDVKLFRPPEYDDWLACSNGQFILPYSGQVTDKADFLDMVANAYTGDKFDIPVEKPTVLYIYLLGHGSENAFQITSGVTLIPGEFGGALDALQTARANIRQVVVMDSCKSGTFMSGLVGSGNNRIVITSASEGQNAYMGNDYNNGDRSFSHYFFRNHLLERRESIYEGWNFSSRAVADNAVTGTPLYQAPLYDDEGNVEHIPVATVGCPGGDGCEGMNTYLLNIEGCLNYRPVDISISEDTLEARIPGSQISDTPSSVVAEVILTIIPPGAPVGDDGTIDGITEEPMQLDDDPATKQVVEYTRNLTDLTAQGTYELTVYGVYENGERSEIEHISYEACTAPGDTDCDGVADDGDGSGVFDNPCIGGETEGCDDNCPDMANPDQKNQDLDDYGTACECNDYEPAVYPGASELCDGLDTDCNGSIPADEADGDEDGYLMCEGDCNDSDGDVNPGATEIPGNGKNDDCDPATPDKTGSCFIGTIAF